jgi:gluconolactonase
MSGTRLVAAVAVAALSVPLAAAPAAVRGPIDGRPDAVVDLSAAEGLAVIDGTWQVREAALVPARFRRVGPDLSPTGAAADTLDLADTPASSGFEHAAWTAIRPDQLHDRVGPGRSSFAWYRLHLTMPAKVGEIDLRGLAAVFEIVVDDYAEVWVNGRLTRGLGQQGGSLVAGFNAPNRVVLTRDARPGQTFDIAVFAANGPLSDPPANYIWVRSATIDFYRPRPGSRDVPLGIEQKDGRLAALLGDRPVLERLAAGFQFTEGPVWLPAEQALLFSDPNDNTIYRWSEDAGLSVFRAKSGYAGVDIGLYHQPGSNGLAVDPEGRLTIAEHGNRRITRLEKNGVVTVLADRFHMKRLNSPNDLVYKSDGALYFTDPPFGLPRVFEDPRKELPFSGVYRWRDGRLDLLATDFTGPNGIAFSPDERYLYVTNWDEKRKIVMRYDVTAEGGLAGGRVFLDLTKAPGEEALDGLKIDASGNLYLSGPGGLWIIGADGVPLGTLRLPELAANLAWGDADGKSLYLTARTGLYRVRTTIGRGSPPPNVTSR